MLTLILGALGFSRPDGSHEALVYKEYVSAIDFLSTGVGHKFRDPMSSHYRKAVLDGKVETLLATQGSRDTFSSLEGLLANFCSFMSPDPAQRARLANDVVIDDASQSRGLEAINALLSTRFTLANIRTSYREIATRVSDSYKNKPIIDQFNEFLKDIKTKASPDDAFKGFDPNIDYRGPVAEEGQHSLAGGTIFSMAGVRFGLEVCLDHAEKRLRTSIDNSGGKQKPVDVQLIPSAGMTIILDAVATRKNGIVFNVDGYRPIDLASVSAAVAMKVFHPPPHCDQTRSPCFSRLLRKRQYRDVPKAETAMRICLRGSVKGQTRNGHLQANVILRLECRLSVVRNRDLGESVRIIPALKG